MKKLTHGTRRQKYGAPPAPLFPPPPPSTSTPTATSLEETLLLRRRQPQPPSTAEPAAAEQEHAQRLPFSNPEAIAALNETIAIHLARIGAFSSLSTFLAESHTPQPPSLTPELLARLKQLHEILERIRQGDCARAIEWVEEERRRRAGADDADADELLFQLRKEEYIRLVLAAAAPVEEDVPMAIEQPRQHGEDEHNNDDGEDHRTAGTPRQQRKSSLAASMSSSMLRTEQHARAHGRGPVNPHLERALAYGGQHFRPLLLSASSSSSSSSASGSASSRTALVCSLLTSPLYLPLDRLLLSPYGTIYAPYLASSPTAPIRTTLNLRANEPLVLLFTEAYLRSLALPKNSPLTVVTDVGGSGALAKIIKVRTVMKEKKTEWSAVGELPVSVCFPLPFSRRASLTLLTPDSQLYLNLPDLGFAIPEKNQTHPSTKTHHARRSRSRSRCRTATTRSLRAPSRRNNRRRRTRPCCSRAGTSLRARA